MLCILPKVDLHILELESFLENNGKYLISININYQFLGGAFTSICHFFRPFVCLPSICSSICCAPYLRDRTSSNYNLWYADVKWWYLQNLFFIFKFDFLGKIAKCSAKRQKIMFGMLDISQSIDYMVVICGIQF